MRWPWQKREPEQRSTAQGYTASLTAAFEGAAVAGTEIAPLATGALEAAAGLYARCMAAAVVEGRSVCGTRSDAACAGPDRSEPDPAR